MHSSVYVGANCNHKTDDRISNKCKISAISEKTQGITTHFHTRLTEEVLYTIYVILYS